MMTIQNMQFEPALQLGVLPRSRLEEMAEAGRTLKEMLRVLDKSSQNMVGQCLASW